MSTNPTAWILKCTDLPQFDACQAQADLFRSDDKLHLRNLCNDTARCASLIAIHNSRASFKDNSENGASSHHKMILDYSRQRVTGETMEQLFDLADAVGLHSRCRAFATGASINATEGKPVLHHVLRMPAYYNLELTKDVHQSINSSKPLDGPTVLKEVHKMRTRVQDFAYRVRSGDYLSVTGRKIINVVVVATGGAHLGTECVAEALKADTTASEAAGPNRVLTFVAHSDPVNMRLAVRDLDPCVTIVIITSPTFASGENPVVLNARVVVDWLVLGIQESGGINKWSSGDIISKQVLAITQDNPAPIQRCHDFGIATSNIFVMPTWINLRFSVCSVAGLLPLSLQYSYPVVADFLDGAHDMDEHFFHAPLRDNIPVILGLLGVWNSTFLGYGCRAVLPYCQSLHRFPAYVQNVTMESNGKRVALDGTPLLHQSGEIDFGEAGGQYSFFQLLHQGRVVPSDFIGFMESQQPIDLPGEALSNHDDMMSNFFAQPDALAYGKTLVDLIQDGTAEPLREHMVFSGNRPSSSLLLSRLDAYAMGQLIALYESSSLLLSRLDAYAMGQLIALYEHRTAVQGFIWCVTTAVCVAVVN
jgi:glucose-6-phosphate isomerase